MALLLILTNSLSICTHFIQRGDVYRDERKPGRKALGLFLTVLPIHPIKLHKFLPLLLLSSTRDNILYSNTVHGQFGLPHALHITDNYSYFQPTPIKDFQYYLHYTVKALTIAKEIVKLLCPFFTLQNSKIHYYYPNRPKRELKNPALFSLIIIRIFNPLY